jgi:solute carrier family 15 (peptide/histidine transporter), member 3/4
VFFVLYNIQHKTKYTAAVCSFCTYLAVSSIAKNLVSYLTKVLHETNVAAARNVSTWQGTNYLAPLFGAFIADSYMGKYWTALIFCIISIIVSAKLACTILILVLTVTV